MTEQQIENVTKEINLVFPGAKWVSIVECRKLYDCFVDVGQQAFMVCDKDQQLFVKDCNNWTFIEVERMPKHFMNLDKMYFNQEENVKEVVEIAKGIDLNKLKNYTSFVKGLTAAEQIVKVKEEVIEVTEEFYSDNNEKLKLETLDVITASINLFLMQGGNEEDFKKHIEKLEEYKLCKYKE